VWRTGFLRDGGRLYRHSPERGYYPAARSCRGKILIGVDPEYMRGPRSPPRGTRAVTGFSRRRSAEAARCQGQEGFARLSAISAIRYSSRKSASCVRSSAC
jgi:hypothetical protein